MVKTDAVKINPSKVAIYIRWSTDEQTSGTTLEIQLNACRNYILSQGWDINDNLIFIDDGYSGSNLNRPDITKLRKYIEEDKVDCVIVYKIDRLSRKLLDAVNLVMDEWVDKCFLKSVTEPLDTTTPLGKQIFYILAGFAEMERDVIKERTWGGKKERAKEGKNAGFKPPYGYITELGNAGNFILVPEEKLILKRIFDMYKSYKGVRTIVEVLNSEGLLNRGKHWNVSTIYYILRNPFYYGQLVYGRHNGEPYSSVQSIYIEPIITKEEFDEIQKIRASKNVNNSSISGRTYKSKHLLTGLLYCSNCNHALGGLKPSTGRKFFYYVCKGHDCKGKNFCDNALIQQDLIDNIVIEDIKTYFLSKSNKKSVISLLNAQYKEQINMVKNTIKQLENQYYSLVKQLVNLEKDYLNGDLKAKLYNQLDEKLNLEIENINLKIKENRSNLENLEKKTINVQDIDDFSDRLLEWDSLEIEQKKVLLSKWINRIEVYKKKSNNNINVKIQYIWNN